jgi:HAD superfamily hydrolase (TIGR01509 family)
MTDRLARRVPWKPGARSLLAELRAAGVPLALVSSSYRRLVDAVLGHLPAGTFATSVAGDEVRRPKPSPEPYVTAAARLGVDPRDCVVLEDSPTGVAAGEAAGAVVVAVPDLNPVGPTPRRPVLSTLSGVRTADLAALVTTARAAGAADGGSAIVAESGSSVTAP